MKLNSGLFGCWCWMKRKGRCGLGGAGLLSRFDQQKIDAALDDPATGFYDYWFKRITGHYSSFKNSILGIIIFHIAFVISIILMILWYVGYLDLQTELQSTESLKSFYYSALAFLIFLVSSSFISKITCAHAIFNQKVNITNRFKRIILLESLINPFGISFSLYKLLHSEIFFVVRTNNADTIQELITEKDFPSFDRPRDLLNIQNLSYKYHGSSFWDKLTHNILQKLNPRWYESHMKYKNNPDYKDIDLSIFDDFDVLKNINIQLQKGRFISIMGCNGSGKTTLLKIINKLISNYNGQVFWLGNNADNISIKSFAKNISYVTQQTIVYNNITVYDYVSNGLFFRDMNFMSISQEDHQKIIDKLKFLSLLQFKDRFISSLSGGERQKAILARALVGNSKVIVLDEPTSFLDIYNQYFILEQFKKIQQEENITIIAILHDLQQTIKYADDVILLEGGSVFKFGATENVLTPANIDKVFG